MSGKKNFVTRVEKAGQSEPYFFFSPYPSPGDADSEPHPPLSLFSRRRTTGGRQSVGVFAAGGLDFAELETAASTDEDEELEWTPPVVRSL